MKWRSGLTLTGLTCWLGMVPACAWLHGGDIASTKANPPQPDARSMVQSTPDRSKGDSGYQVVRPGADPKTVAQQGPPQIFNIPDRPTATQRDLNVPVNPSSAPPVTTNVGAMPNRSAVRPEFKNDLGLATQQENRVVQPQRAQPVLTAPPNSGVMPDVPATFPVAMAKQSDHQVLEINPQPARESTTHEAHSAPNESPILAFVRLYLDKRPAEAVAQLSAYDKTRQDLLLGLLSLAVGVTEGDPTKIEPQQVGVILTQLKGIARPLVPMAPFTLTSACLCVVVREFGDYDKLPPDYTYRPGGHMEIYVEMLNFFTVQRDGGYEIWLSSQADIYDDANRLVPNFHLAFDRAQQEITRTWSPLRDFHRRYSLNLPSDLPPGKYTLRLQVQDKPSHRVAKYDLPFTVMTATGRM